jgi:hypothetical protein
MNDTHIIDSVVLVMIDRLNKAGQPYGIRALVKECHLADKTIAKAIKRLADDGRIRVIKGAPGARDRYEVLLPPNGVDEAAIAVYMAHQIVRHK